MIDETTMKITDIRTFLMHAGAPDPSHRASDRSPAGAETSPSGGTRNWLFLKVDTDEGVTGIGECSGWPRVIETAIHELKPILVGQDPTHVERIWQSMLTAMMGVGAGAMSYADGTHDEHVYVQTRLRRQRYFDPDKNP